MNILITGASGFIGSALANGLNNRGYRVSLLVRKNSNLKRIENASQFNIGKCNLDEIGEFICEVKPDIVIHMACCYGRNGESESEIYGVNVELGLLIMESLEKSEKKTVFINTSTALPGEVSIYSSTKLSFEKYARLRILNSLWINKLINIKLQHVYGPGDKISKFTTLVVEECMGNKPSILLSAGEQKRDFVYIDDVVEAYKVIIEKIEEFQQIEEIEIGTGKAVSIKSFVKMVHKITKSNTKLLFGKIPYRINEKMIMVANTDRMKSIGWEPKIKLIQGIKNMTNINNR